jgi:hypothetical protein
MFGAATARTVSVCCVELLNIEAVRVTSEAAAGRPACVRNIVSNSPVPIVTLGGPLNTGKLLDNATITGLVAALVSVTVQVALRPAFTVPGLQLTADNRAGASRFNVKVCVIPPPLPVITAV